MSAISIPTQQRSWLPYVALSLAVVLFSWGAIFVRLAQAQGMPSLAIAAIRYSAATLILTPYILSRERAALRRLSRRDIVLNILAGMLLATAIVMVFSALEHTTILIANVINNSQPLWVAVMEVLILGAALGRRVWIGLALALAGTILFTLAGIEDLSAMGSNPLLGGGLALASALIASLYLIVGRAVRSRVPTLVFMWISLLSGSVLTLSISFASGIPLLGYPAAGYLWTLAITFTGQLIGHSLIAFCLAHLPATLVSISNQVVVVLSAVLAFLIFNETPGPLQILASGVILSGVMVTILHRPGRGAGWLRH